MKYNYHTHVNMTPHALSSIEEYVEKDETFFMKGHTDRYILLNISAEKAVCKRNINSLITVKYN